MGIISIAAVINAAIPSARGEAACSHWKRLKARPEAQLLIFLKSYRAVEIRIRQRHNVRANQLEASIARQENEIQQLTQNLAHIREVDVIHIISAQIQAAHDRLATLKAQRDALLYESPSADLEPYFEAVLENGRTIPLLRRKKSPKRRSNGCLLMTMPSISYSGLPTAVSSRPDQKSAPLPEGRFPIFPQNTSAHPMHFHRILLQPCATARTA